MKILYIGYWGANEGLSQATINPNLEILLDFKKVRSLTYVSIERSECDKYELPSNPKLIHLPFRANHTSLRIVNKIFETIWFGKKLIKLSRQKCFDLIICRTSLAGVLGLKIHNALRIPFIVESFEPHADYMRELKIWKPWGISYHFQKRNEWIQKKKAFFLYPVAENYRRTLLQEGLNPKQVITVPCCVDLRKFRFDATARKTIRNKLSLKKSKTIGIYVGKFGGIYFSEEQAFTLFQEAFKTLNDFHLILLTPHKKEILERAAFQKNIDMNNVTIQLVSHQEVSKYLSASDFAFSLIKSTPFRKYCSPIKNGEYWASGLPILIPRGIGDDSEILANSNYGVIFDIDNLNKRFREINKVLSMPEHRHQIQKLALVHRSLGKVKSQYSSLVAQF